MTPRHLYRTLAAAALVLPLLTWLPACESMNGQQTAKELQRNRWNQTRINVLYQLAQQQYQVGDYDKARDEWTITRQLDPSNIDAASGLKRIEQIRSGGQ